ncbi:hypothetical protein [Flavobacterium sp. I-STPA6A]|uniref:hypothetical protein n=1 Tax=Flavobacterium sp. I-STPA6A TaxID=2590450 RepID=UPI00131AFD6D|nr:hypothetical protein [Flavobacterium sp. I-STPA6A]
MKKLLIIAFVAVLSHNNCSAKTINQNNKIVKIDGKYYKEKDGVLFPLLGVVLNFVAPNLKDELIREAIDLAKSFFAEKKIQIVDESEGSKEFIEIFTINVQDNDSDGNIELSSSSEDHDNDGTNDYATESAEYNDTENGMDIILDKQLRYIDQFYSGDVDGDGEEN